MENGRSGYGNDCRARPYLSANSEGLSEQWRNIGVRIEDDVLVTKDGYDILSKDAPKTIDEIEELMANAA